MSLFLIPIGFTAIFWSKGTFAVLWTGVLLLAAWEYLSLFRAGGLQPAGLFVLGGVALVCLGRAMGGFESDHWLLAILVLGALTYHLMRYEQGIDSSGTDFGVTLAGILYIGWVGAYWISARYLPHGDWWVTLILLCVWGNDSAAYLVGKRFGRHKLSPRLSPKKTWEGYWGGAAASVAVGAVFGGLFAAWLGPAEGFTVAGGALLGLLLGVLTTFGDLGESMIKRQVGIKDSGKVLPGHGGIFDRIDSWLWAGVIGYYFIVWFVR